MQNRVAIRIRSTNTAGQPNRTGGFIILSLLCLIALLAFASLSVDVGYLTLTKTRMQMAVDAAALAAAQEITNAVQNAPLGTDDPTAYAIERARDVAIDVAALNGVYVERNQDIAFGQRIYQPQTKTFSINWGVTPANVVKVTGRRTNADPSQPDGKLKLFFAGVSGEGYARVQTTGTAYVEARDIVVVHDFSRSMNFDSHFSDEAVSRLSDEQIVSNLRNTWDDLNLELGNLDFEPDYLTLSDTSEGVAASVTFKYDRVSVTTSGQLQSVKLRYTNDSTATFNVSGQQANVTGSRDIANVWITSTSESQPEAVTLKSSNITVEFSADRKTATIRSNSNLEKLQVKRQNGQTTTITLPNNTKHYEYSSSSPLTLLQLDKKGGATSWIKFDPGSAGGDNITVTQQFDDTDANVRSAFGLDDTPYPFPYGSWNEFISHCRTYGPFSSRGYRETYGGLTFANYVLRLRSSHAETPALCQARHYPFSSLKEGHSLLCSFLGDLGFDDEIGMVSYDTDHRVEKVLNESDPSIPYVNISSDPITNDYEALNHLMKYRQANHYSPSTNMGGGLEEGIALLEDHARAGARPTLLLMTDGNSNVMDRGKTGTLPSGWDWDKLLDYDGDGSADYTTSSTQARYVLKTAYAAAEKGYTIHAMSVGMDADRNLLRAVAFIGKGIYIDVPGGVSVAEMEDQIREAFHKIGARVPPAKLVTGI